MKDKCKILFIIPSLRRSGAEMQVVDLLLGFDRSRFELFLFTFDEDLSLKEKFEGSGVHHVNHVRRSRFDFSMVPAMARVIDENGIDVIFSTLQIALLLGWISRIISKKSPPIVHALHKTVSRNNKETLLEKYLYQWPMRACSRIICVCKNQEEYWQGIFPYLKGRTEVIYNGVNNEYFDRDKVANEAGELRSSLKIPENAVVIACIAAFRAEKNHTALLKAFSDIPASDGGPYLLLAGKGPEEESVRELSSTLPSSERIVFMGTLSDVRPLIAASNFSVIASTAIETFSIAMLESMSMSCPVISTDIGGHKEAVIPEVTGDIVTDGRVESIGPVLRKYVDNKVLLKEMGSRCRQMVLDKFSAGTMVKRTQALVTEVHEGRRGK